MQGARAIAFFSNVFDAQGDALVRCKKRGAKSRRRAFCCCIKSLSVGTGRMKTRDVSMTMQCHAMQYRRGEALLKHSSSRNEVSRRFDTKINARRWSDHPRMESEKQSNSLVSTDCGQNSRRLGLAAAVELYVKCLLRKPRPIFTLALWTKAISWRTFAPACLTRD